MQTSIDALSAELGATREQIKEEMAPRLADNAQSTLEAHARVRRGARARVHLDRVLTRSAREQVDAAEDQLRLAEEKAGWLEEKLKALEAEAAETLDAGLARVAVEAAAEHAQQQAIVDALRLQVCHHLVREYIRGCPVPLKGLAC